jgi:hypothetical protein
MVLDESKQRSRKISSTVHATLSDVATIDA